MEIVVCSSSDKLDDLNKLPKAMNNEAVKTTTTHPIQAPSGVGVLRCANNILAIYELLVFGKSVAFLPPIDNEVKFLTVFLHVTGT